MNCDSQPKCESDKRFERILESASSKELPRSQLIEVLHQTQDVYGFITPAAMAAISMKLGVSMSRIYGVTTFYHYFNLLPRGTYAISVCMGTACYVKGAPRVLDAIKEELKIDIGETTPDRVFTLLETRCLGACGLAPTMMINNRIYGELSSEKAVEILRKLRAEVTP